MFTVCFLGFDYCLVHCISLGPIFSAEKCYKCSRPGHFARECRMDEDRCYKCNQLGHVARDCSKDIDSGKNSFDTLRLFVDMYYSSLSHSHILSFNHLRNNFEV